jgi:hypothetical protein
MKELRALLGDFRCTWANFNQPFNKVVTDPRGIKKPTVIVVSDEIFAQTDNQLSQMSRTFVPNTLRESTMIQRNPINRQDPTFQRKNHLH